MYTIGRVSNVQELMRADRSGDAAAIRAASAAGGEVDRADGNGQMALIAAVLADRLDIVRILLDAGADRIIPDGKGRSALESARGAGLDDVVALFEK